MTVHTMIPLGFTLALLVCMGLVIVSDAARYTIPNSLNLAILILWLAGLVFLPAAPLMALAAAGIVLVLGLGLFSLGLMGGGDIKLLVVLTLWTGWGQPTLNFIFLTAIAGGILVVIVLLLRFCLNPIMFKMNPTRNIPRLLSKGQPVPYGLAIAAAFLWLLYIHGVPMLPRMA